MDTNRLLILGMAGLWLLLAGCRNEGEARAPSASSDSEASAITNRIDVSDTVRRNLGITFAKVESRAVSQTLRVPGRFELLPDARREYRTMLGGRVEILVSQFQRIEAGALLYRLDSPPWRDLQQKLSEAQADIRESTKRVEMIEPLLQAHKRHHDVLEESVKQFETRIRKLGKGYEAGSVSSEEYGQVQSSLMRVRADLAEVLEKETELAVRRVEVSAKLDSARSRFDLLLDSAATLLDTPKSNLIEQSDPEGPPRWRTLEHVEVTASAPGIVETIALTPGGWANETSLVMTMVQPERIRFHAHALQSDLNRLKDGLSGAIAPGAGNAAEARDRMSAVISLGISADADQRTIDLYATSEALSSWARPGVSAFLDVTLSDAPDELAIPLASVIQDGLARVFFRRDPKDPDKVIRLEADLGANNGQWVVIQSGVREGDEVVLDGVYQLMLATSGSASKGGHFHPDGTWHDGEK